jgi:hypothetical protein
VAAIQAAFASNPRDIGVGLYNPKTGEICIGSFDQVTQGGGHQGLADALGITDNSEWRGFVISSDGSFNPASHFNRCDGSPRMKPDLANLVEQTLRQAGLVN